VVFRDSRLRHGPELPVRQSRVGKNDAEAHVKAVCAKKERYESSLECGRSHPSMATREGRTTVSSFQRLLLALAIIAVDAALFVVPVAALFLAYVIVMNPKWFRDFLNRLNGSGA
jgi:hypothetical protein